VLSGAISSGPFSPLSYTGEASEVFIGQAECGLPRGTKAPTPVKSGLLEGSVSFP